MYHFLVTAGVNDISVFFCPKTSDSYSRLESSGDIFSFILSTGQMETSRSLFPGEMNGEERG